MIRAAILLGLSGYVAQAGVHLQSEGMILTAAVLFIASSLFAPLEILA